MTTTPLGLGIPTGFKGAPVNSARQFGTRTGIPLNTAVGTTEEIPFENASGGTIHIPAASPITSLTYHAAPASGGTYLPLYDKAVQVVTQTVSAGKCYELPTAVFGCGAIKIVVNSAGNVDLSIKG
jgi:hypothetical protein